MEQEHIHSFSNVDSVDDSGALVRFLDVARERYFGQINARSFALLRVGPGSHVLDVGCGLGADVCALSELVGSEGRVVGLDNSQAMLNEARCRAANSGACVDFQLGDVQDLAFPDESLDGVRASRVLTHTKDPKAALKQMVRVTRKGGRVVAIEPDHETLVIPSPEIDCTRKVLNCFCDNFAQGWTGRWLPVWFRQLPLQDVQVEPFTVALDYDFLLHACQLDKTAMRARNQGLISAEQAHGWLDSLRQAASDNLFYSAITFFMVSGEKT